MSRRLPLLVAAGLVVAAVAASLAGAASPVAGTISGPITAVKGSTFTLKTSLSPTGSSKVSVGKATTITEQATASAKDVAKGVCVFASGQRSSKGVVTADRVQITPAVKGQCSLGGFGRGGSGRPNGTPPNGAGGQQPPAGGGFGGGNAGFGFAAGLVSTVKGSSVTVKGRTGSTAVTLTGKTTFSKTASVGASALSTKLCAFVRGTSSDKGVTVTAQDVALTKPTANGCTFGFRRPGQ